MDNPSSPACKPPVDIAYLRAISEGDIEMEKELVAAFIDQGDVNLSKLKENRGTGKGNAWAAAAHGFKGCSGSMGADVLAQLCHQAQHAPDDIRPRDELFSKIENEYERVKAYLRKRFLEP